MFSNSVGSIDVDMQEVQCYFIEFILILPVQLEGTLLDLSGSHEFVLLLLLRVSHETH